MTLSHLDKIRRSEWIRATAIRCARTFFTTILGVFTADTLITEVDWKAALLAATSATVYILILCIVAGLPEVDDTVIYKKYYKSDDTLPHKAVIEGARVGYLIGAEKANLEADFWAKENGLDFRIDWLRGQKTGFFIDQRVNRDLVRQYSKGRKVLNTFCYTGGFSVAALAGGAKEVVSIDLSERAVKLAEENVRLNFGDEANHTAIATNAVEYLRDIDSDYDLIILDPPAFAKHHKVLGNALQGYKKINARALEKIRPGGILFTFSCVQPSLLRQP